MRILLNTHTLIWWFYDRNRLSAGMHDLIDDSSNEIFVSAVSAWEVAQKVSAGKLTIAGGLGKDFVPSISDAGFLPLPISQEHMLLSVALPSGHKDPFDRILAAQAIADGLVLISIDPRMADLGAPVL